MISSVLFNIPSISVVFMVLPVAVCIQPQSHTVMKVRDLENASGLLEEPKSHPREKAREQEPESMLAA